MAIIRMVFHFNKNNTFYITLEHALQRQERMKNRFQHFEMVDIAYQLHQ